MKRSTTPYWAQLIALSCVAVLAAGCGTKKKHDSSGSSKPSLDTEIDSVKPTDDGKSVTITYKNKTDAKDVAFKCQVEEDGKAGDWSDCDAAGKTVDIQPGSRYVFRVKAVADGTEEVSPASAIYVSGGGGGSGGPGTSTDQKQPTVATKILNKGDVPAVYTKAALTLNFGVDGDVNVDDLRFECKRETEQDFRRCPNGDTYDFGQLINGSSYTLAVRAVDRSTNAVAAEDTLSFKVALNSLSITSNPDLGSAKTGLVKLAVSGQAPAAMSCTLDGGTAGDCTMYVPTLNLDLMAQGAPGSHSLKVEGRDATGQVTGSTVLNFCAGACSTSGGAGSPQAPVIQAMQIGSFYQYIIPQGMHITEYATTKTYNDQLQFYRITTESDPYYIGNYTCDRDFDKKISGGSPSGKVYDYCYTTPQRDLYKWLTDFRLANNHLELATDADQMNPYNNERTMINVFDRDYEFMHGRSRFEQLCLNKRGTIQKTPPIRFIDRNFWGENVKAEFFMCVAELTSAGPGLPQANDEWWIGAFFITSDSLNLPRYECFINDYDYDYHHGMNSDYHPEFCGTFSNPNLLEVVYMTKTPFREAADFAQAAQTKFLKNLSEISPILH